MLLSPLWLLAQPFPSQHLVVIQSTMLLLLYIMQFMLPLLFTMLSMPQFTMLLSTMPQPMPLHQFSTMPLLITSPPLPATSLIMVMSYQSIKVSEARKKTRAIMMLSEAGNLHSLTISWAINMQSHNKDFWAQITSFLEDFWSQKSSYDSS